MKQLSQKVALVTGAGSGIGKAIAKLFAEQGAKVMLTDIHQSNIEAVAAEIRANGGMVACIAADISVKGDVQLVMKHVHNTFGTLDILVNNAGVMDNFTPVTDVTDRIMGESNRNKPERLFFCLP
ncbi:SDR family NAD(P)-dependent oxidoreductase [Mucilaginibacter sp. P19]|uniref:SDR family NAD(P)-dependent oxidoreductase n=1 Tax=Mucilaginibacter sp. P19 TaxID=3423947 RepID=UPI003D66ED9B